LLDGVIEGVVGVGEGRNARLRRAAEQRNDPLIGLVQKGSQPILLAAVAEAIHIGQALVSTFFSSAQCRDHREAPRNDHRVGTAKQMESERERENFRSGRAIETPRFFATPHKTVELPDQEGEFFGVPVVDLEDHVEHAAQTRTTHVGGARAVRAANLPGCLGGRDETRWLRGCQAQSLARAVRSAG
jgi:hypothetical protein